MRPISRPSEVAVSKRLDRILSLGLILAASALPGLAQGPSDADRAKVQEQKVAERITAMKADPANPYFAASKLSPAEQNALADTALAAIDRLAKAEPPDTAGMEKLCLDILRRAPSSPRARLAHWALHALLLQRKERAGAQAALESYLAKYKASESEQAEAYDKLAMIAWEAGDSGLALYYSDRYLALNPKSYALMLTKARSLIKEGDAAAGEKLLRKIIAEAEGSVPATLAKWDLNALGTASQPPDLVAKYKESLERLRWIVMAVEDFRIIKGKLPASLADLVPDHLASPSETDSWGNRWIIELNAKANAYRIASAGSDGRFSGFGQKGEYSDLAGRDIIFADGAPVLIPAVDD